MSTYKSFCTDAEVEVGLDEWSEAEITEYMTDLGYVLVKTPEEIHWLTLLADAKMYQPEKFDALFSECVYKHLGRVV